MRHAVTRSHDTGQELDGGENDDEPLGLQRDRREEERQRIVRVKHAEAQQQAVATLMRYCGQSVQMEYDTRGSAAAFFSQYLALVNDFDYRAATLYDNRYSYGIDEWDDIISIEHTISVQIDNLANMCTCL